MTSRWQPPARWCSLLAVMLCSGWLGPASAATVSGYRRSAAGAASAPTNHRPLPRLNGIPQSQESLGSLTAPVVIALYGDLECSLCRDFVLSPAFARLIARDVRVGKARIVYRSLCTATCAGPGRRVFISQQVAAYAAGAQRRFWQYAVRFLEQQGEELTHYVTAAFLDRIAHEVRGLDYGRWLSERRGLKLPEQVRAEDTAANRQNIGATPTLVVRGPRGKRRLSVGVPSFRQIAAALAAVG